MKADADMLETAARLCKETYERDKEWIFMADPDACYLAIQGTTCIEDWVKDFKFLFRRDDTHRGFEIIARQYSEQVQSRCIEFPCTDRTMVICGHSMGGAVAQIIASYLGQLNKNNLAVVTFGAPRPGGRGLRYRLKGVKHYRFVHGNDPVQHCPPWINGYVHTAPLIHLPDVSKTANPIDDHCMGYYYESFMKLEKSKQITGGRNVEFPFN